MTATAERITTYPAFAKAAELLESGRCEEAAMVMMSHLRAHPGDARGFAMLGTISMKIGALLQAEQFLRKAIALGERSAEVLRSLASNLNQQERLPEALDLFEQIDRLTGDPAVSGARSLILEKLGRNAEALGIREKAIERAPDFPPVWLSYGLSLRYAGRTDEAIAAYRRATEIDFELGESWWALASIKSKVLTDDDIATMEQAFAIAIDVRNIAPLHFSMARAWHDRQEYARAFHHYTEGNRIRAEDIGYQAHELTDEVAEYVSTCGPDFFDSAPAATDAPVPIFIVSLPRSGSTLLEQMLGSHSDIEPAGELPYIPALLRSAMEHHTRRGRVAVPQLIRRMVDEEARALGDEYLRRAALHHPDGTTVFVDKLPHNWSNILFIRRILPNARFIDIRRSAMDCCFSNFTQSFSRAHAASFALHDIGQCYVDYVRLMDHLAEVAPGLVHHVRYERLIEEPEAELRAIFSYLGIEWSDAPLNFHQLDRVVRTPSAEQVRRPLNREGVGAWKPYEEWLGPLRDALGPLADA
jgi:tetratricopeptide (TPR) repeat protein